MPLFSVRVKEESETTYLVEAKNQKEIEAIEDIKSIVVETLKSQKYTNLKVLNDNIEDSEKYKIAYFRYNNFISFAKDDGYSYHQKGIFNLTVPIPRIGWDDFEEFPKYIFVSEERDGHAYNRRFYGFNDVSSLTLIAKAMEKCSETIVGVYDLDEEELRMKTLEYETKVTLI